MKIGFIGLGIMGKPMAGHLIKGGHTVYLMSRSGVPQELTAAGGIACAIAEGGGAACRYHHHHGARHARRGQGAVRRARGGAGAERRQGGRGHEHHLAGGDEGIRPRIAAHNCEYLDAPVSGGEVGAKNATLTIMVGGPDTAFHRVKPVFELMGKSITLIGANGTGQITQARQQHRRGAQHRGGGRGAACSPAKAGADPAKVRQALMGGFAASRILEVHGERMIKRTFEPGFRIGLHQKDLNIALAVARELGVSLPNTATAQELFNACVARGGAEVGPLGDGEGGGDAGRISNSAAQALERFSVRTVPHRSIAACIGVNGERTWVVSKKSRRSARQSASPVSTGRGWSPN